MSRRDTAWERTTLHLGGAIALMAAAACRKPATAAHEEKDAAPAAATSAAAVDDTERPFDPKGPKLAAIDMQVNVYTRPDPTSPRYGYLRLGTVVDRDAQPAGNDRCPGGWF